MDRRGKASRRCGAWQPGWRVSLQAGCSPREQPWQGRLGHRETRTFPGAWMRPGKLRTVIIKINLSLTPWSTPRKSPGSHAGRFAMDLAGFALSTWCRSSCGCGGRRLQGRLSSLDRAETISEGPSPPARTVLHGPMHLGKHKGPGRCSHTSPGGFAAGTEEGSTQSPGQVSAGGEAACTRLQSRGSWVLGVRLSKHGWFLFN